MNEKEILKETFFTRRYLPESPENLNIEEMFDVVHHIENKYKVYFELENKPLYGHYASFKTYDNTIVGVSEFCEFRIEAIEDAITSFLE